MMYATAGNLDTFLLSRGYPGQPGVDASGGGGGGMLNDGGAGENDNTERIKAFRRRKSSNRGSGIGGREEEMRGVLYLGQEEVASLFGDVVEGLAFLVR